MPEQKRHPTPPASVDIAGLEKQAFLQAQAERLDSPEEDLVVLGLDGVQELLGDLRSAVPAGSETRAERR